MSLDPLVIEETDNEPDEIEPDEAEVGTGKNVHAAALGRLGGRKGGPARARKLSAARRSEIARKAATARWQGERRDEEDE